MPPVALYSSDPARGWLPWAWLTPVLMILFNAVPVIALDGWMQSQQWSTPRGDPIGRAGAGPDHPLRHAGAGAGALPAAIRQRPGVHQPRLHAPSAQLWPATRVHHATLPAAERDGGTCHSNAEGTVRSPTPLRERSTRHAGDRGLDRLLQPTAASPRAEDDDPGCGLCRYINRMT